MLTRESITYYANQTIQRHQDKNLNDALAKIRQELSEIVTGKAVTQGSFPVKFENDIGMWEIHENGNVYVQPKTTVEHINISFSITTNDLQWKQKNLQRITGRTFFLDMGSSTPVEVRPCKIENGKVTIEYLSSSPGRKETLSLEDFATLAAINIDNEGFLK